jgi:RNA polymerase sporulation-specific sigma factor
MDRRDSGVARMSDNELVLRARNGDAGACAELVARYEPLAMSRCAGRYLAGADHDDLRQEAFIGLLKAVCDFDPDNGAPFCAFARLCIDRHVISAMRSARRDKHAPLYAYIPIGVETDPERGEPPLDIAAAPGRDPESVALARATAGEIRTAVDTILSGLERAVIHARMRDEPVAATCRRLGVDAKSVDNALQRARRKLAASLER